MTMRGMRVGFSHTNDATEKWSSILLDLRDIELYWEKNGYFFLSFHIRHGKWNQLSVWDPSLPDQFWHLDMWNINQN